VINTRQLSDEIFAVAEMSLKDRDNAIALPKAKKVNTVTEVLDLDDSPKKDLDGSVTLTFDRYRKDSSNEQPTNSTTPVQVTIVGRPAETNVMRKHYYIYSKQNGFDMTFQLQRLSEEYNVHFIHKPSKSITAPLDTQFYVFDEARNARNKLNYYNLMAMTDGTTRFTAIYNSLPALFVPRVQVIMLSNKSPYDLYGTWNTMLQRRVMSALKMNMFNIRFEVICLDGSVEEDRIQALEPKAWNDDQLMAECKSVVDHQYKILTMGPPIQKNVIAIEKAVDKIVMLCREREPERDSSSELLLRKVLRHLDDGRFSPTLMDTFDVLYESVVTKEKGNRLKAARENLVVEAWSEDQFLTECKRIANDALLTDARPVEMSVMMIETAVDHIVKLCRQRERGNEFSTDRRAFSTFKELDDGRYWPTLVYTLQMLYQLATKKKGRCLEAARHRLICETSSETAEDGDNEGRHK